MDKTILVIAGGAAVLFIGSKVVDKVFPGVTTQRNEAKQYVPAVSTLQSLLDESYVDKVFTLNKCTDMASKASFIYKRYGIQPNVLYNTLSANSDTIDDAIGFLNDTEVRVFSVLGTMKDRFMSALLASTYRYKYGMRLADLLFRNLNEGELAVCYDSLINGFSEGKKEANDAQ